MTLAPMASVAVPREHPPLGRRRLLERVLALGPPRVRRAGQRRNGLSGRRVDRLGGARLREAAETSLGFGRIVAAEIEVPNMLANLV
jgi:hypothetical protein